MIWDQATSTEEALMDHTNQIHLIRDKFITPTITSVILQNSGFVCAFGWAPLFLWIEPMLLVKKSGDKFSRIIMTEVKYSGYNIGKTSQKV